MYYTVAHVTGIFGGYKLSVARKHDVTNKLTAGEIQAGGGIFWGGKDYATWRGKDTYHYYTQKRHLLFERFEQMSNNRIIIPPSNSTQSDYEKLLKGGGTRYKGTRLYVLPGKASTVEERAAGNICPPAQLNPDYERNPKLQRVGKIKPREPKQPQVRRENTSIPPELLKLIYGK
ncbi:Hypothetical predicted protein [Paramuricea clavata]|uniref:Uncharacterized protein n=1 Tax=Paramuricea clavata TaxID=317549 RepID=A0A6S7FM77_PARCT|nr:Hypothetical predicted protein [Paramuricea clavata]